MMIFNENSDFIRWEKRFELGIPVIDAQHKRLVALCNDLYLTIVRNKYRVMQPEWQEAFSDALRATVDYITTHFSDEEKLLSAVGYAELDSQKSQHRAFTAQIARTLKTFHQTTFQDAIEFVKFLYDWILHHIAVSDKQYVSAVLEFCRRNGA